MHTARRRHLGSRFVLGLRCCVNLIGVTSEVVAGNAEYVPEGGKPDESNEIWEPSKVRPVAFHTMGAMSADDTQSRGSRRRLVMCLALRKSPTT